MNLPGLGINWIPEGEKYSVGKLWHHHGHKLAGGGMYPAKNKFMKVFQNIIFGHHHKYDYFSMRQYGTNTLYQSIANGNIYTLEPEYAHHTHWTIGFTEINYGRGGAFTHNFIHISETGDGGYEAIHNGSGRLYESYKDEDIDKFLAK